ncbi:putative ribonuclease H protein [Vitis vinifera]|uniref:Putative ribonuclease H protein n=1 Tax=Vitis vinifera TaxID=29760 RepID=A0A438JZX9_VITVI|nr:putative ribonuclease H protein [Vitis vinifera]
MASAHRRRNCMDRIKLNGVWLSEEQEVRVGVVNVYQQLLSENLDWKADIGGLQLDQISQQEAGFLELPFSEEEVHSALMEMNGDKAPGPDGFTMAFWQKCWEFVKEEGGLRTLGILDPSAYWGGIYKLLTKVLANRLKKVLGKCIVRSECLCNGSCKKWDLVQSGWGGYGAVFPHPNIHPGGFLCGCSIGGGRRPTVNISHLLFADDTVVFCEAKKEHLLHLSWILFWFEAASGLRINLAKSEVIPVGEVEEVEMMAAELGCEWERKVHLVKWEVVCADKEKGGLGVRKLAILNKVLLGKWIWRFACDKENLWKQVLLAKYGQEGLGWRTKKSYGVFGVGVWKEILKESAWCWENMTFLAGKGNKIRFWYDQWCGCLVLSQRFPHLYAMAVQRNATVEEMWDQNCGQRGWNLRFIRDFNDWELDMLGNLLHDLRGSKTSLEEDSVLWKGERNGHFRVKAVYSLLANPLASGFPKTVFGWKVFQLN